MANLAPRQALPDELRGFALLGIILVNAPFIGLSISGFVRPEHTSLLDRVAEFIVVALFQGKFYLLFSFLFGYSAHLILGKGGRTGAFVMRLIGLAVLGCLHALLFFVGDILLSYAFLGFFLIFAQRWSNRRLIVAAGTATGFALLWMVALALIMLDPLYADLAAEPDTFMAYDAAMKTGSFVTTVIARFEVWPDVLFALGTLNWGFALACFFLGMLAGRYRLLAAPDPQARLWRWARRLGLIIGLPLNLLSAWLVSGPGSVGGVGIDASSMIGVFIGFCAAPLLSVAYVGLFVWVRVRFSAVFALFRTAGRMSLTLYIGESVLLALLFCGWGAGLFGTLGAAAVLLAAVAVWALLEVLAKIWLRCAEQGPLEALLRRWCRLGQG